jgi:imidazoleglycerol phosphate dehydratase HisB
VFAAQQLPINFEGETDHPMHSCWLSLFDEAADSLLYLVTETVATGRRHHITEKTFKPIAMGMPFVIVGTKGSLKYLRSYGFRTFEGIWDESYDDAEDDVRIQRIASLLRSLDELSVEAKQDLFDQARPIIEHNWNHFYGGGFEAVLWQELKDMLDGIESSS